MNVSKHPSTDDTSHGGGVTPPSIGSAPGVLPEVQKPRLAANSQTGVSTRNVPLPKESNAFHHSKDVSHWYVLRTTYGREKKAYEYLKSQNVEAFYPTLITVRMVEGKRKSVECSRLPNVFFAYGTEVEIKSYVYDNMNLPYLRFYYRHYHVGTRIMKEPLIVPDEQIESLRIICASEAKDIVLVPSEVQRFKAGQNVRVIDGGFKGVKGRVARYQGQQRVAVIIEGVLTIATAYIPSAFLELTS